VAKEPVRMLTQAPTKVLAETFKSAMKVSWFSETSAEQAQPSRSRPAITLLAISTMTHLSSRSWRCLVDAAQRSRSPQL
jgi:hypothetical protein